MTILYYDLDDAGDPVPSTLEATSYLWEPGGNRRVVAVDDPLPGVHVSTVFLILDHGLGREKPVLFETMVFGGELDQECERYHTRAEALAGHARMVSAVLNRKPAAGT